MKNKNKSFTLAEGATHVDTFDNKRKFGFTLAEGATHVGKFDNKRKFGFTLAEVLITLGIIGVVAVLTVPNIVSNYQKKVYVAQLQKVYNQISNAVSLLMVDEEVDNLNDTYLSCISGEEENAGFCNERGVEFLKKYFKVSKDCTNPSSECLLPAYKNIDGTDGYMLDRLSETGSCVITSSNYIICVSYFSNNSNPQRPMTVFVDVNGLKKPNVLGRDAFNFDVNYQGEIAESFDKNDDVQKFTDPTNCPSNPQLYGLGCFTKIINDGWKMDY